MEQTKAVRSFVDMKDPNDWMDELIDTASEEKFGKAKCILKMKNRRIGGP